MTSIYVQRLVRIRNLMKSHNIDALLIRSTDQYLNEYVPKDQSRRVYISGFTGSIGDVLITATDSFLFVDGRYALQSKNECPHMTIRVAQLGQSIEDCWLHEITTLKGKNLKSLALESDRISVALYEKIEICANNCGFKIVGPPELGPHITKTSSKIWSIPHKIAGQTTLDKLKNTTQFFLHHKLDAILMVLLDEIAWLTNLRGDEFPYQATFASKALVFKDEVWMLLLKQHKHTLQNTKNLKIFSPDEWQVAFKKLLAKKSLTIGIDKTTTSEAVHQELKIFDTHIVFISSPFAAMKAIKNKSELMHMRYAFAKADLAVQNTQDWTLKRIIKKQKVSEYDVEQKIRKEFVKSGAVGLSFKPICAAGKNGAVIHYGTPNKNVFLKKGNLFLLDTGAYYEGGYATDLTRTFLVGNKSTKAKPLHKKIYTYVLKAAIAGMNARFPKGTTGAQLDAIVRNVIWQCGINFNHGTGHGVGINVHESPPSIRPNNHFALTPGHVFSVEPGLYIEGIGGVRIENLCTVAEDPNNTQFLCVLPLTFAPLDARLFEKSMLNVAEKTFLKYYKKCFKLKPNQFPSAPPHDQSILFGIKKNF